MSDAELRAQQRFDELIVWYLNGSLDAAEQRWVEEFLRTHPQAQHDLAWHRQLKQAADIKHLRIAPNVGLASLMSRVRAHEAGASSAIAQRLRGWLAAAARPGFAMAAVLVLGQAVALGWLIREVRQQDQLLAGYSATRAVTQSAEMPALQVTFKSEASEREIRLLLLSLQARIVDGPRQLGDYTIAVPASQLNEAKSMLEQSRIVEVVSLQRAPSTP